jgi:hypothetical protein
MTPLTVTNKLAASMWPQPFDGLRADASIVNAECVARSHAIAGLVNLFLKPGLTFLN